MTLPQSASRGGAAEERRSRASRALGFAATLAAIGLLFWFPLRTLWTLSLQHEYYSHIPLIPLIALSLLWWERRDVFHDATLSPKLGTLLLTAAVVLAGTGTRLAYRLGENDFLSVTVAGFVVAVWGAFMLCYGRRAFHAGLFPLLLLLLMAPIPELLRARLVSILQQGSAEACSWLFQVSGVPVFRENLVFTLPSVKIEIAEACSGIRSTIALTVTALVAGHLFLRSARKELVLMAALLPVVIFKNALRIVTITLLGIYVNRSFLRGSLHHDGGFLFFLLGMAMLAPLFFWLRRQPQHRRGAAASSTSSGQKVTEEARTAAAGSR